MTPGSPSNCLRDCPRSPLDYPTRPPPHPPPYPTSPHSPMVISPLLIRLPRPLPVSCAPRNTHNQTVGSRDIHHAMPGVALGGRMRPQSAGWVRDRLLRGTHQLSPTARPVGWTHHPSPPTCRHPPPRRGLRPTLRAGTTMRTVQRAAAQARGRRPVEEGRASGMTCARHEAQR